MLDLTHTIDWVITQSRLNAVARMKLVDRSARLAHITSVLEQLKPGPYLIGTGPSAIGIIPLTVDNVV
jgi:hypothetical protein